MMELDGDTKIKLSDIRTLRRILQADPFYTGAVSGRIIAFGNANPLVWAEKFAVVI